MKYYISLIGLLIIFGCSKTPDDIPIASYADIEAIVTFSVNMSAQIESGNFNIDSDFLDIAGTFNDWDGSNDYLIKTNNNIYEISFTNFEVGEEIEFKFRINGNWNTAEFPSGSNRQYVIIQGNNNLELWYNDEDGS